jgi:hypothetical protein
VRKLALILTCFALVACATPTQKIATAQIARDFYRHRFDETCLVRSHHGDRNPAVPQPASSMPAWCDGYDVLLNSADHDLREGVAAMEKVVLTHGAKMPLQLHTIELSMDALAKGYKP